MAVTYYQYLKEGDLGPSGNNFKNAKYIGQEDNSYWEEGAPYFFPNDILAVLGQKIFYKDANNKEVEINIAGLQCCTVKVTSGKDINNDYTYSTTLALCPIIEIDNQIYRPTGIYSEQDDVSKKSNFYTKNIAGNIEEKGVLCACSCRKVNYTPPKSKYTIEKLAEKLKGLSNQMVILHDRVPSDVLEPINQEAHKKTFITTENYIPKVIID